MKITLIQSFLSVFSFFTMAFIYYSFVERLIEPKVIFLKNLNTADNFLFLRLQKFTYCVFFAIFFTLYNMFFLDILIKLFLLNLIWLLSFILFKGSFKLKITLFLIYTLISCNIEVAIVPFVLYFTKYNSSNVHFSIYFSFLYTAITYTLNYFTLKYISNKISRFKEIFDYKEVNIIIYSLIFMLIITYGNSIFFIDIKKNNIEFINSVISFSIVSCVILILNIIKLLFNYTYTLHNYDFTIQTLNNYDEFINLNEEYIENVNKIKHDIHNHILISKDFLKQNDVTGLKKYIDTLDQSSFKENPIFNTGNTLLNFILSQKLYLAKSKGVQFTATNELYESIQIPDNHFAVLLFNLLDNAINAAYSSDLKYVNCLIKTKDDGLIIVIKNSVEDIEKTMAQLNNVTLAKKSFKREHGYGLYIIKDIVTLYNGVQKITHIGNDVEIFIALNNQIPN